MAYQLSEKQQNNEKTQREIDLYLSNSLGFWKILNPPPPPIQYMQKYTHFKVRNQIYYSFGGKKL